MCVVFPWCSELRERVAGRLSWRGSSSFCDMSRDIDPMRLDLPATTCLLHARTGSCRRFERTRDLGERCLLRFAYAHAADAKKSALLGGLGNVLADLAQPALEGCCIAGRLGIHHCASLPQRLDALGFDLTRLAACELLLEAVARGAPSFGSLEVGDDCFDQRIRPRGPIWPSSARCPYCCTNRWRHTGGRRNRGLGTSGGQHCEFRPLSFDCRLQQLGNAGDRQHLIE